MDAKLDLPSSSSILMHSLLEPCNRKLSSPPKPTISSACSSMTASSTNTKLVSEDRPWVCEKCSFPFKYKNNLLEHMRFFHMKGSVPCNKCSQVFATSTHLRLHRKDHSLEQGKCPHCRYSFPGCTNNPEKYRALYRKHLPECRRCPAKISSQIENKSSLNDVDSENFDWCCLGCYNRFSDLTEYETHECQGNKGAEFSLDVRAFASTHFEDITCQSLSYPESDISYEVPATSCDLPNIDFNFLCVICGVNFENEDKLNLHLYESHQTCDHDAVKTNSKSPSSKTDITVPAVSVACQSCNNDCPDKSANDLEDYCKIETDIPTEKMQEDNEVTEELQAEEEMTNVNEQLENNDLYLAAPLVSKENEVLKTECLTEFHDSLCAKITEAPEISSSVLDISFACKFCNALFLDSKESELHEEQCKLSVKENPSEVIVQWLCKYCKVAFASKSEMRTHKEVCSLEYKTSKPNNVLVRWVCKYCKENFETRESMCTHKKTCLLKNKDKSVASSTESDISEITSKEGAVSNRRNSLASNASDNNREIDDRDGTQRIGTRHLQIDFQVFSQVSTNNMNSNSITPDCKIENMTSKKGVSLHDETGAIVADELEPNSYMSVIEPNIEDNLDGKTPVKDQGVLFPFSDQDESVLVKWVCKYCKEDFEDRESMRCHKTICKLRRKGKNVLESGGSDNTSMSMNEKSCVSKEQVHTTCMNSNLPMQNTINTCNEKGKSKPHICEICGKKFAGRVAVKAHKLECHMFKCSRCGRYFQTVSKLWKHSRLCRAQKPSPNNRNKLVFTCKKCYRVFRERYRYNLHKLSCQHEMTKDPKLQENLHVSISGHDIVLRIQCTKCTGSYIGNEIFSLHTCEDPRALEVFMDCRCGMTDFPNLPTLYSHCLKCSSSNMKNVKNKSVSSRTKFYIMCFFCHSEFNDVFLYYLHLVAHPYCRVTSRESSFTRLPIPEGKKRSLLQKEVIISEDENNDWTCSFCKFIISSSIPRIMHYKMCKTKVCYKCGFFSSITKRLLKHSCNKGLKYMASAKVLLQRIPPGLVSKNTVERQSKSTEPIPDAFNKQPRVQRCVICYKKCKFDGVSLPPIGQLECFQCRNKMHRKELKKHGETFFSRSLFDKEETSSFMPFQEETTSLSTYLDPSKRLRMSRALTKGSQSSHDNISETLSRPDRQHQKLSRNSALRTRKIVEKCSHCKRGFSSKGQLEKHVKLSKTCMHAETTKENIIQSDLNHSSIINFVDFLTSSQGSLSLMHSEPSTPSEEHESLASFCNTQNNTSSNSVSSLQNDNSNSDDGSSSNSDNLEDDNNIFSQILSGTVECNPSQTGRTSFLVLEEVEKVMNSHKQLKRVPISPALQCDGWLLKSGQHTEADGTMKSKFICGACFKSFTTESVFLEHVSVIHQLSSDVGVKLNIMKHIPNEMINKLSW